MKSFRVSEHVFVIEAENKSRYPFCNCLLINDKQKCLVDSGAGAKRLMALGAERIGYLVNSHFHEDHTWGNVLFKDAEVCCHDYDAEAVESVEELKRCYGAPNSQMYSLTNHFLEGLGYEPSKVSLRFKNDDEFSFGTVKLTVIHTPGHSIGHCCFLIDDMDKKIIHLSDIDLTTFGP
nr:MBL fold metallo-hydrolase [Candidatus Njordarchaeum guaymaensis]